jgi:hypothetical protein
VRDVGEDAGPVERVPVVEVDRSVELEDDVAVPRGGKQVDAHEIGPDSRRSGNRELARRRRRLDGTEAAAERHVRPPLAGRGDAGRRADHLPAGDDDAKIMEPGRYELLDERPVSPEPGELLGLAEAPLEIGPSPAEEDVATQLPKRGLTTTGGSRPARRSPLRRWTERG